MERPWPLTGRDAELRTISTALRPGAAGIVVAGPAGVGKTRLAREAVDRVPSAVWAHGSTAAQPYPLGAFAGVLDVPEGDATTTVARTLHALQVARPGVLAVDDGHLLDELSAIVLHRAVVRRLAPVVVTLRAGEPAPDAVTALWKDDLLPRIDLRPLSEPDTTALVARVLGGPVDSASARRLWRLTEGSPLFVRHLLGGEVAAGRFTPAGGIWRWTDEPTLSPGLATLLEREMGALDPAVQDVLDIVALAEPVAVSTVAGLASAAALESAERTGLVRTDGVVARLAHPLYGEVRRVTMGTLRGRRLRGRISTQLDGADPIPRAVLAIDSDLPPDPALFLRGANAAIRLYDLPLAERLAAAAAATGDWQACLVHASALSWLSRGEEAEALLADLAATAPDPGTAAMVHLHRTGNALFTLASVERASAALDAARATGAAPVFVAAMSLALAAAVGEVAEVRERGPLLMEQELPDLAALLTASAVSAVAAVSGLSEELARAAAVGGLTADSVPTGIPGFGLADFQVLGHRLAGRPSEALEVAGRMQGAAADLPGPARLMALVIVGHALVAGGRVGEALVPLREAWAGLADSGHEFRYRCRTLLASALGQSGKAVPSLEDRHPAYTLFVPDDLIAEAWGAAASGAVSRGTRLAEGAADLARRLEAPALEVLAWQTAVQLGAGPGALPRLTDLESLGPRAATTLAHARALVERDGDGLLAVSAAWEEIDLVAAGDAAAQAAVVLRERGRQGSSLAAAARAERLAARSGARTPALLAAAQPLPLTAREREIATLAAQGLSNKAIAERLTVSVRTVEGHLYRLGHKLGISDRAALAEILESE